MADQIYANTQSFEGNATTSVSQTLSWYSRKITVTNDGLSNDLSFYPNGSANGTAITVKPQESITLDRYRTLSITVSSTDTDYRVWVFG